ncbi:MAG TPA: PspC domain-containing protein [Anaeromyxobacter sp.]|nr:PspC domain-containing protein [Anaeromyxobacter sp.]
MLCPYCRSENVSGATRCAACTSWMTERPPVREWTRARGGRLIGGVARGLSDRFGLPVAAARLLFLVSVLFGGWGILAYVALWIAMPLEPPILPTATTPALERQPSAP